MSHCILFIQKTSASSTRNYSDYESVNEALDGVCKIFEDFLRMKNPSSETIAYDIFELFDFIDQLRDLSILVLNKQLGQYSPKGKEWIKQKLHVLLKNAAAKNSQ